MRAMGVWVTSTCPTSTTRRLVEDGKYCYAAAAATAAGEAEGCEYYEYEGSKMKGEGDYRAEEYYEGDGGLDYVHLPDVNDAPEGRLGGDRHPPARMRGLPLFCRRSWAQ